MRILQDAITLTAPRHSEPRRIGLSENGICKEATCEMVPLQNVRPDLAKGRGPALSENQADIA